MSHLIGRRLRIVREIPWPDWHPVPLPVEIKPGAIVFEYKGYTYGSMTEGEIAVSVEPGVAPFWGVPRDAVQDAPVEDDPLMAGTRERAKRAAWRMIREAGAEARTADKEA